MRAVADYGNEPEATMSASLATEAIETARHFVETIATTLAPRTRTPPPPDPAPPPRTKCMTDPLPLIS
jgi:hypothetical protein